MVVSVKVSFSFMVQWNGVRWPALFTMLISYLKAVQTKLGFVLGRYGAKSQSIGVTSRKRVQNMVA
ncbi:hypothetical protein JCM19053_4016 [Vibrio sp. JCM 19053]|nr:hypothetical protein JCM19053_4016 [Vibrio sp. JCM 19053]